ncbi:MAG: Hint domain-containing protein [Gemmataceae bacterium]
MRRFILIGLFSLIGLPTLTAADPNPGVKFFEFQSKRIGVTGMPLADCDQPVMQIHFTGKTDEKGQGKGSLVLDFTGNPQFDEFGFETKYPARNDKTFECTIEFVKKTTKLYVSRRLGADEKEGRESKLVWSLYRIKSPAIKTPLFISSVDQADYGLGRFLVQDDAGKVKYAIDLQLPPRPEPCHPGCFPPGTEVRIATGTTTIEKVQKGDSIMTISPEGQKTLKAVSAVFVTRNRLLEVRTRNRMLTTTETQPLALVSGGYRPAGELKPGDRIWIWADAQRTEATVDSVTKTKQDSDVYNLVLGEPTTFIAGGFLVRSKPPLTIVNGPDSPVLP